MIQELYIEARVHIFIDIFILIVNKDNHWLQKKKKHKIRMGGFWFWEITKKKTSL